MKKNNIHCLYRGFFATLFTVSLLMIDGIYPAMPFASATVVQRITTDGAGKYSISISREGGVAGWLETIEDSERREIVIVKAAATNGSWNRELFRSSTSIWASGVKGPNYDQSDTYYNLSQRDGKILFSGDGSRMVILIDEFAKSKHYEYFNFIDVRTGDARLVPVAAPPGMGTYTGYTNYNTHGVWLENGRYGYTLSDDGRFAIYSIKAFGVMNGDGKTLDALVAMDLDTGAAVRIAGYQAMDSAGNLTPGSPEYKDTNISTAGNRAVFACDNAYYMGGFNGAPLQKVADGVNGDPYLVGDANYVAEENTGNFYPVAGGSSIKTSSPERGGFAFSFWDGEAGFITHPSLSHGSEIKIVRASGVTPLVTTKLEGLPAGWNFGVKSLSSSHRYSLVSADGRSVLLSLISPDGKQDLFLLKRESTLPPVAQNIDTVQKPASLASGTSQEKAETPEKTGNTLLFSQDLVPSGKEQMVSYEGLNVIIPGGLISNKEELRILKPGSDTLPLIKGMKQVAMVDIQIGNLTKFSKPLTIEMKYEKTMLDNSIPVKRQIIACYFDEKIGGWIATPFEIDENREVLIIKTSHLTKWSAYYFLLGYDVYPGKKCTVIYDKGDIKNNNALYEARTGRKGLLDGVPVLVQDIALFIDQAYSSYEQEGFKLPVVESGKPETKLNVFVGDIDESTRNTKSGIISINANLASKERGQALVNLFKQDCGHELFHEVQAYKFGISGLTALYYEKKAFWLEATAEYAGDILAWKHAIDRDGSPMSRTGIMGNSIKSDYLRYSLFTFEVPGMLTSARQKAMGHEYDSAHFVAFVMKKNPQAQHTVIVDMMSRDSDFIKCFNAYFGQSGKTLDSWLNDFGAYFLVDPSSPYPAGEARNDAVDEFKGIRFKMSGARAGELEQNEITETFSIKPREPYSAAVALTDIYVNGKTDRENESTAFEVEVKTDKDIRLLVTGKEDKAPQKILSVIKAASSPGEKFQANGQDKIYLIYASAGVGDTANVTIKAKVINRPEISVEPGNQNVKPGQASTFKAKISNGPAQPLITWDFGDGTGRQDTGKPDAAHTFNSTGSFKGKAYLYDAGNREKLLAEAEFSVSVREDSQQEDASAANKEDSDKFIGRWDFRLSQERGITPDWLDSLYGGGARGTNAASGKVLYYQIRKENGKYVFYPNDDRIEITGNKIVSKYIAETGLEQDRGKFFEYYHEGTINSDGTKIEGRYKIVWGDELRSEGKWWGTKTR